MISTNYDNAASGAQSGGATTASQNTLANKEVFLQLLVAQIKNQNPLNPADGVEFLTQLSQFTELEQMMGMRSDMAAVRQHLDDAAASADQSAQEPSSEAGQTKEK